MLRRGLVAMLASAVLIAACGAARTPEVAVVAGDAPPATWPRRADAPTSLPSTPLPADDDGDGLVQVVLWGDSLAFEAREAFLLALADRPQVEAETRTLGGVAICDYL